MCACMQWKREGCRERTIMVHLEGSNTFLEVFWALSKSSRLPDPRLRLRLPVDDSSLA